MMVYLGQTRASAWIARLNSYGFGEATQPDEYPPRRKPWFFDCGAFKDWQAGRPFNEHRYCKTIGRIICDEAKPSFVVVPDKVAAGLESLKFSMSWVERLLPLGPLYLVVQDGMTEDDVYMELGPFAGIFVGGSMDWKHRTAGAWVSFAHRNDIKCHIGRAGTEKKVRWARRIGADSIDSCTPLWAEKNFQRFLRGFDNPQTEFQVSA